MLPPNERTKKPQQLILILEALLLSLGFWRFPQMPYFVRNRAGVRDVIGWRWKKDSSYALYFGVWVPELEEDLALNDVEKIDESIHIQNIELMHDLSPRGLDETLSAWWNEQDAQTLCKTLSEQVLHIALPYFDTFASFGDVAEMVYYDQRYHNTATEQRLFDNAFSAFFNYELEHATDAVVAALKPLQKLTPAFQYSGGYYWRPFGEGVFHIIVPQFYAAWRFVRLQAVVWHPFIDGLEHGDTSTLPEKFSRVAWKEFTEQGKDATYATPAFLGESGHQQSGLDDWIEGVRAYGLVWLENIKTKEDVRAAIRPELAKFYPF